LDYTHHHHFSQSDNVNSFNEKNATIKKKTQRVTSNADFPCHASLLWKIPNVGYNPDMSKTEKSQSSEFPSQCWVAQMKLDPHNIGTPTASFTSDEAVQDLERSIYDQ